MKVGVLGTGDVGRALAVGLTSVGHEVVVGSRDPSRPNVAELLAAAGPRARAGTFAEAASAADLVVLAVLGEAVPDVLRLAGPESFTGKVVVDVTNPLVFADHGPPGLSVGHTDSLGEQVQRALPDAKVVKAFNIVGNPLMFRPDLPGGPPDMWICGNDDGAKQVVTRLLSDFGWPSVVDIGGIDGARLLESLCLLWVRSGMALGNFTIAFRLLRR